MDLRNQSLVKVLLTDAELKAAREAQQERAQQQREQLNRPNPGPGQLGGPGGVSGAHGFGGPGGLNGPNSQGGGFAPGGAGGPNGQGAKGGQGGFGTGNDWMLQEHDPFVTGNLSGRNGPGGEMGGPGGAGGFGPGLGPSASGFGGPGGPGGHNGQNGMGGPGGPGGFGAGPNSPALGVGGGFGSGPNGPNGGFGGHGGPGGFGPGHNGPNGMGGPGGFGAVNNNPNGGGFVPGGVNGPNGMGGPGGPGGFGMGSHGGPGGPGGPGGFGGPGAGARQERPEDLGFTVIPGGSNGTQYNQYGTGSRTAFQGGQPAIVSQYGTSSQGFSQGGAGYPGTQQSGTNSPFVRADHTSSYSPYTAPTGAWNSHDSVIRGNGAGQQGGQGGFGTQSQSGTGVLLTTNQATGQVQPHWINNYVRPQPKDEVEILREWFSAVDQDRSGTISQEELASALEAGGERFNYYCVKMMIDMFDRRSNGTVDFLEFTYLFGYIKSMRDSFEGYDANRSGALGVNELNQALLHAGYRFANPHTLLMLCDKFDKKRKGQLAFENFLELGVYLGSMKTAFQKHGWPTDGANGYVLPQFEGFVVQELQKLR